MFICLIYKAASKIKATLWATHFVNVFLKSLRYLSFSLIGQQNCIYHIRGSKDQKKLCNIVGNNNVVFADILFIYS